jgi:DNA-binding response OmpR family regulator
MSILLVEPDFESAYIIKKSLKNERYLIDVAEDGEEAVEKFKEQKLIISEIEIPKINGFELIKEIRKKSLLTPILILTNTKTLEAKIHAFNLGADDFLPKPICLTELTLRIKALLKRNNNAFEQKIEFKVADLILNPQTKEVERAGKKIELRKKEFELLEFLIKNKGIVFNRNTILEYIWDYNTNTFTNTVDVHIKYLREKIDHGFQKRLIKTVHGVGYKICAI